MTLPFLGSASADALGGPDWLRGARAEAATRLASAPMPTSALEDWRYSRIDALELDRFSPSLHDPGPSAAESSVDVFVGALGHDITRIDTHDGWVQGLSGSDPAVTVGRIQESSARPEGFGEVAGEPDSFAVASRAFAPDPVLVEVAPGSKARQVVVVHWCSGEEAVFPRVLLSAGQDSQVSVIEVVAGTSGGLVVPVTEIDARQAARISYVQLQILGDSAWQIALQASRVSRDASLLSAAVALGGDYARLRTVSDLTGPGGSSRLVALYFGTDHQMHDFRTLQGHRAPKTHSDLLYKGVVANEARSVYSGLIRVDKGARGTNAFQTNRNLVLHEGAHADSVPNLEIEDNDVRCSHASAVGPVSEDQRFYLESRGVPSAATDRLISLGFLGEVIDQLPSPELAPALSDAVAGKLAAAEAIEVGGRPR